MRFLPVIQILQDMTRQFPCLWFYMAFNFTGRPEPETAGKVVFD